MRLAFFKRKIVFLFLLLFQSQLLIGNEPSQFEQIRYYVAQENITICEDGIMILGGASPILVGSLFHDECGFYFLDAGSGWVCNWCKEVNPLEANICQACGKPHGSSPPRKR